MSATFEDKIKLIRNFQIALSKSHEAALRIRRTTSDEEKFREIIKESNKLSDIINDLIGNEMREWSVGSKDIVKNLKDANDSLQKSINNIKKDIEVIKNLTVFMGKLDEIINIAVKVIGGIL